MGVSPHIYYMSSNDAPVGVITNSISMYSSALVGFKKILPVNVFESKSSGVFETVTRKSIKPLSLLIESKIGLTESRKSCLTLSSFCSNNKRTATAEINLRACNNSRLTLILSRADSLICSVLLPQITVPTSLYVAIGLSLPL